MRKPLPKLVPLKAVAWVRRLVPICPYDATELRADSIPGWAYYECPCCKKTWDMAFSRDKEKQRTR